MCVVRELIFLLLCLAYSISAKFLDFIIEKHKKEVKLMYFMHSTSVNSNRHRKRQGGGIPRGQAYARFVKKEMCYA